MALNKTFADCGNLGRSDGPYPQQHYNKQTLPRRNKHSKTTIEERPNKCKQSVKTTAETVRETPAMTQLFHICLSNKLYINIYIYILKHIYTYMVYVNVCGMWFM